jgi:hypothetical protein
MSTIHTFLSIPSVRDNLFIGTLLLAYAFFSIGKYETNTLLAIIVISGASWLMYGYLAAQAANERSKRAQKVQMLNDEGAARLAFPATSYQDKFHVLPFPKKGFKYLAMNTILVEIATSLGVVRMFDKARYADLLLLMNQWHKMYVYILSDRYEPCAYLSTFNDLGDSILENMYSMIFVFTSPDALQHVYGVVPEDLLDKNIKRFTVLKRRMTQVLTSYSKKEKGVKTVPLSLPRAADTNASLRLP